jgi:hypothetical protein
MEWVFINFGGWWGFGSADLRRHKIGLSITRCIIEFGQIEAYGKNTAILTFQI